MRSRARSDVGFTLVELLIAIAVLGIIITPLTAITFAGYRSMSSTSNRLAGSSEAQYLSIYLPPDIKSADSGTTASITCTNVTNAKLKLTGDAFTDASVPSVVIVYWVKVVTVGAVTTYQLTRSNCTTGTATGSVVVIRSLSSVASVSAACTATGCSMTVTKTKVATESADYVYTVAGRFRSGIA